MQDLPENLSASGASRVKFHDFPLKFNDRPIVNWLLYIRPNCFRTFLSVHQRESCTPLKLEHFLGTSYAYLLYLCHFRKTSELTVKNKTIEEKIPKTATCRREFIPFLGLVLVVLVILVYYLKTTQSIAIQGKNPMRNTHEVPVTEREWKTFIYCVRELMSSELLG